MSRLKGKIVVPGDKSVSHRALIFGAMSEGHGFAENLSNGDDVYSTVRCLKALGVRISVSSGRASIEGLGWRGLKESRQDLDAGNSGTTMRLLTGVLAGHGFPARIVGDDSLSRRPMNRVAAPLRLMGAKIDLSAGGHAPIRIRGAALEGIDYVSPVASAQVKSAVLLAGILATGSTSFSEPAQSRDHTERMLPMYGIPIEREGLRVRVKGGAHLAAGVLVRVPGDPSSAAFWVVAGTLSPHSDLTIKRVCMNPTRIGYLSVLERMGAKIKRDNEETGPGEPTADLRPSFARLSCVETEASEAPNIIDEIPILALAAAQAEGLSRFKGLAELRHKESDRLEAIVSLLDAIGADARSDGDDLVVEGPRRFRAAKVSSRGDHRIAMTALIAGLVSGEAVKVDDADCVKISYPDFLDELKRVS